MNSFRPAAPWICARCRAQEPARWSRKTFVTHRRQNAAAAEPPIGPGDQPKIITKRDEKTFVYGPSASLQLLTPNAAALREYLVSQDQPNPHLSPRKQRQQAAEAFQAALLSSDARALSVILASTPADDRRDFLRHLSKATWTQTLRLLTSTALKPAFHRVHRAHSTKDLRRIGYFHDQEQYKAVQRIVQVATVRHEMGIKMNLLDYRVLLQCSAAIGDGASARRTWLEMKQARETPDIACYNSYMSAILWDESSRLEQLHRARDTKQRHRPLSVPIMTFRNGTATEVRDVYNEMLSRGITGDAMTCSLLIVASGREGRHLEDASSMLTHFWGIDMQSLARAQVASPPSVELAPTSPMYPSTRVLSAIAEAFGSQNEIPLALRLIDYFNEHYDIPVKRNIWHHLLYWMWMHARAGTERSSSTLQESYGRVLDFVRIKLKQTGDKVLPIDELHMIFKIIIEGDKWANDRLLQVVEEGRMTYVDSVQKWYWAVIKYRLIKRYAIATRDHRRLLRARRHVKRLEMEKKRQFQLLRRWARALLKRWNNLETKDGDQHAKALDIQEWQQRTIPKFLQHWQPFVYRKVRYKIATGDVQLSLVSWTDRLQRAQTRRRIFPEMLDTKIVMAMKARRRRRRRPQRMPGVNPGLDVALSTE